MDSANKTSDSRPGKVEKLQSGDAYEANSLVGCQLAGGRYKLLNLAGEGSMAHVFMAYDNRLSTDVVVKIPKPERVVDPSFRRRFAQERQLLVQLSHPHIVRILDMGEHEDLPFLVMQFLSGGDLFERLKAAQAKGKRLPVSSLKSWLREIGRALDFVAQQGLVHRDVKPSNILFDNHRNAFLSDFGLAKITYGDHTDGDSEMTGAGFVVGTPNYLAPELVLGQQFDGKVDQYALGILVYHLLTGAPPMQGASSSATMVNQTNRVLPLLSRVRDDVPEGVAAAVQKAIHKKPSRRFASSSEFAEAVLAAITSAESPRPSQASGPRKPRRQPAPDYSDDYASSSGQAVRERVSVGQKGLVKCPACQVPLPLSESHAGRKGRCIHCQARLRVSRGLTKLYLMSDDSSGSGPRSGKRRSDHSDELIIGEKVFGWQLSRQTAMILSSILLVVTISATVYLTVFMTSESAQEKLDAEINSMRSTERSN